MFLGYVTVYLRNHGSCSTHIDALIIDTNESRCAFVLREMLIEKAPNVLHLLRSYSFALKHNFGIRNQLHSLTRIDCHAVNRVTANAAQAALFQHLHNNGQDPVIFAPRQQHILTSMLSPFATSGIHVQNFCFVDGNLEGGASTSTQSKGCCCSFSIFFILEIKPNATISI